MASKTPLNSYIATRVINGAPSQVLFNGAADAASIKFYQPNPTLLDAVDPFNMVDTKNLKLTYSYEYNGSTSFTPIPITGSPFTGFIVPLSRRYKVKLVAYSPGTTQAMLQSAYNFGTGDLLRLVADIQPFIAVSPYGTDGDFYYNNSQDFSILDYRKGLIFTSATGSISAGFVIPKLNFSTTVYEVEINLNAGDFVAFGVTIVPQLSAFKITTTPYDGADRITLLIQASITQIED